MTMLPLWRWSPPSPLSFFSPSPFSPPSVVSNTAAAAFSATSRKKPLPLPPAANYMPLPGCQFIATKTTGRWRRPTTKWRICSSTTRSSCSSRSTPTCTWSPCTGMSMRCRAAAASGRATDIMICAELGGHRRRSAETYRPALRHNARMRGVLGAIHGGMIFIEENPECKLAPFLFHMFHLHCSREARIPLAMWKHVARVSVLPVTCATFATIADHLAYKYRKKKWNS
jgi:hypothetical protein